MKAFSLRVIALASLPAFGACADTATNEPTGPGFEISVAPLQLQGIGKACYDIKIENGVDATLNPAANDVVVLTNICSDTYGNGVGGDITYIAPCDATSDSDSGKDGIQNTVTVMPTLYATNGTTPLTDWENPCTGAGCALTATCSENADTLVEFNFTIMRQAQQGFFDVAVNFSDIFCSAKVDCRYKNGEAQGDWIRLVHGDNGIRTATSVVAFACTDGNDAGSTGETRLYASNVTVTCDADGDPQTTGDITTTVVDVSKAGNVDFNGVTAGLGNPAGPVEAAAVYMGSEALQVNGTNAGKVYWNTAIGFDETSTSGQPLLGAAGANCTLTFTATAAEGTLNLNAGQSFLSYPFVQATVPLTNGTGALTCTQHPLDSGNFAINYLSSVPASIAWTVNATAADAGQATTP